MAKDARGGAKCWHEGDLARQARSARQLRSVNLRRRVIDEPGGNVIMIGCNVIAYQL